MSYSSRGGEEHLLFVSLGVSRACVERPQVSTLTTEDVCHLLLVCFNYGSEFFFLLFDVFQRLVNIILLSFGSQNIVIQSRELQNGVRGKACPAPRTYVVTVFDQGAVPDSYLCRESIEVAHMHFQFGRPPVNNLFDALPFEHRWRRDGNGRSGGHSHCS
jgi:hypothetical protein